MKTQEVEKGVQRWSWRQEVVAIVAMTAVMLGIYNFLTSTFVQDLWRGWWYDEPAAVQDLRADLELTGDGKRIFLATQPAVEEAESFNEHCGEHQDEVSLLGCYNGGKIYVYDVKLESLKDSNKVTVAHELLHAVWARMGKGERGEVSELLEEVQRENSEWTEQELSLYREQERIEELYVRVGTKLKEIPQGLEEHYAKYFANRARIVEFYENYQAPFRELQERNEDLRVEVLRLGEEIETERAIYEVRTESLTTRIEKFNLCAGTAGCFASDAVFERERADLEQERKNLTGYREKLNQKIEQHNNLVLEYEKNCRDLGELNNALNSNMKDRVNEVN